MQRDELTIVNLSEKKISRDDFYFHLNSFFYIHELILEKAELPEACFAMLIEFLKNNTSTLKLNLNEVKFGDRRFNAEDMEKLSEVLKENQTLQVLSLATCDLGNAGIIFLAKSINSNNESRLTELNLRTNGVDPEGYKVLADMLQSNYIITKIDLKGNKGFCNTQWEVLINGEISINKNTESEEFKNKRSVIFKEMNRLLDLQRLLSSSTYKNLVGIHAGLSNMGDILKNYSLPILSIWPLLETAVKNQSGFFADWKRMTPVHEIYQAVRDKNYSLIKQKADYYSEQDDRNNLAGLEESKYFRINDSCSVTNDQTLLVYSSLRLSGGGL